ncbi:ankyrin repeat domain-containing protein SOWAHB [Astyanax mexicanus]|uniref:Ankyrin repeat domain-containing protein SOWAHB n=1 Tax=Astyanax mexicanus TaxID=7994 RepID=A0A8T2L9S3_ASTMX|nr:ankyrin repeat domain-containing protein SOWAHB [Astyanax mexicanus]
MAADFTQDSVLRFLLSRGGTVRNTELLAHFTSFLREQDEGTRARNREQFKRFVNSVAVVKQDGGVSYIALKKKHRQRLESVAKPPPKKHEVSGKPAPSGTRDGGAEVRTQRSAVKTVNQPPPAQVPADVLPVAGILNDNNNDVEAVNLEKCVRSSSAQSWEPIRERSSSDGPGDTFTSESKRSSGSGQSFDQPWDLKGPVEAAHNGVYPARSGQLREVDGCSQKWEASVSPVLEEPSEDTLSCAWPFPISSSSCGLSQSQISTSTPCLSDIPGVDPSLQAPYLQGALSQSNDSFLTSNQGGPITGFYIEEASDYSSTGSVTPVSTSAHNRRSLPSQTLHLPSSTDSDWHKGYSWSSDDGLNYRATSVENRDALHHFHEAELLLNLHRPERQVTSWHHSTGHLADEEPSASLPHSVPENGVRPGPVARRLSQRMRSRMSRSLGSDLDQAFREDNETSRIKRLQRISSFLNVNHPTSASVSSSRTHSTLDGLSSAGSKHSLAHDSISCSTRQSQVPLESREHEWFVKAASGSWNVIYSLFREDPSLLNKRDFVSGYTVLHWIAKHGDHRVLNTLWYGVNKIGMMMDVDARSACGYTPLHLAAIHSQKNLLRLLVTKFKANVALRDNSGKKPWQYLEKSDDWELMELMGAPRKMFGVGAGSQWSVEKTPVSQVVQSAATVKRHSSLAALFKHKSQLRVSANAETFL